MAFQIVKSFAVKAPPDAVWRFLIDPHRVAGCMPGAAITGQVDDRTFTGTMTVKVGPVTTSYKGKVVFERLDADQHVAEIVATGQDVKGKGGASMKLSSSLKQLAPGETEITASSDVTVSGLLAQMGRGMIQDVSDELFEIFSKNVRAQLDGATPAAGAPAAGSAAGPATGSAVESAAPPATVDPEIETREVEAGTAESGARAVAGSAMAAGAAPQASPQADVLDLGGIGARAALRMLARPTIWIVLAVAAVLAYLLFFR